LAHAFAIAVGLRVVAAIAPTVMTEVALFAIGSQSVTSNIRAVAMPTQELFCNRKGGVYYASPLEPLPPSNPIRRDRIYGSHLSLMVVSFLELLLRNFGDKR
jgi:hypothetical protein